MNVKDKKHVDRELDSVDEHQKECRQEEVVKQYGHYRAHLLNTTVKVKGSL